MEQTTQSPLTFHLSADTARRRKKQKVDDAKLAAKEAQRKREAEDRRWCEVALKQILRKIEETINTVTASDLDSAEPACEQIVFKWGSVTYNPNIRIQGTTTFNTSNPPYCTVADTLKAAGYTCSHWDAGQWKSEFPVPSVTICDYLAGGGGVTSTDKMRVVW
eukprot:TRINITY_DN67328_c5_g1_i1.p1 TRINITY_DN67328_c5_g1~~TRINITY_DN67328_c5_g1_i1.p1  ORF type:complete len:163 (-),score=9.99 TRINITY_DN67328_c5_g1_i1:449-937(-)